MSCTSNGEILKWTGSAWACAQDAGGIASVVVASPLTGNGVSQPVALPAASATADGYLPKESFASFDAKVTSVGAGSGIAVAGTAKDPMVALGSNLTLGGTTTFGGAIKFNAQATTGLRVEAADAAPVTCNAGNLGYLFFNRVSGALSICTGTRFADLASANPATCKVIKDATPSAASGTYLIDPDGLGPIQPFTAYCDMTTDGGGWTIVAAHTSADNEQPLVSDTEVGGNPLSNQHYNLNRARKMAISANSTESLFRRGSGVWLKADKPMFDANLATANSHSHVAVSLRTSDNATASGFLGYSNYNITGGGDFGLTNNSGFDHHSTSYWHLNSGCLSHYLYSYSTAVADSDAAYDVNLGLSAWGSTASCASGDGAGITFYSAMR